MSPRPHDTGLLTLYTQNLSEFDLHARAILHLPISDITALRSGACHTINAEQASSNYTVNGLAAAEAMANVEAMLFGKPDAYPNRRLGIVFAPMWKRPRQRAPKYIGLLVALPALIVG